MKRCRPHDDDYYSCGTIIFFTSMIYIYMYMCPLPALVTFLCFSPFTYCSLARCQEMVLGDPWLGGLGGWGQGGREEGRGRELVTRGGLGRNCLLPPSTSLNGCLTQSGCFNDNSRVCRWVFYGVGCLQGVGKVLQKVVASPMEYNAMQWRGQLLPLHPSIAAVDISGLQPSYYTIHECHYAALPM